MNNVQVSNKLGIKKSALSAMLSGRVFPGKSRGLELEKLSGIDLRLWLYGPASVLRAALEDKFGTITDGRGAKTKEGEV